MFAIILYIFNILKDWLLIDLLPSMLSNFQIINVFRPYPLLGHFFSNIYMYLIPYAVIYISALAMNFDEINERLRK